MKFYEKSSIFIKLFSFVLCVFILFISPYSKYLDTHYIEKVHAVGGVVAVEGGSIVVEWLLGLLASAGLGVAAYENREALASSYDEYLQAQIDTEMFVAHKAEDFCMQVYDKASDTIQNIPWQDYVDKLGEVHDTGVDNLTDIYVKLCPSLLGTFDDFISSIFAGETYVPGISDIIEEQYFTDSDIREQIKGTYDIHYSAINHNYQCPQHGDATSCTFSGIVSVTGLSAISLTGPDAYGRYILNLAYASGKPIEVMSDVMSFPCGYTKNRGSAAISVHSFSANIPIFIDFDLMRNYLATGTGYTDALNYTKSIYDTITDNDDLPTIGQWGKSLWEWVANSPDCGIGTYGDGTIVNDWATDLPFIGLTDLQDYVANAQDVFEKAIDDIIAGVYDPATDIPDNPTYEDVWHDVIDGSWDDVIDNPVNNPAKDPTKPIDPSKPVDPSIPADPTLPVELPDVIDVPLESVVPTINDSFFDVAASIKYKFPFSIPWDLRYLFTVLANTPKAPYFELPIIIKRFDINEMIIVDMARFQVLSNLSRSLFSLIFAVGLIKLTFLVVGMRKEE